MLIYHPLTDAYHNLYRNLAILQRFKKISLDYDTLLIFNYFFLFPQDLRRTTLPQKYGRIKKMKYENKFNIVKNTRPVIQRLKAVQDITIQSLVGYGLIDEELYLVENKITLLDTNISIPEVNDIHKEILGLYEDYLVNLGSKELKKRTKILQYRYEQS